MGAVCISWRAWADKGYRMASRDASIERLARKARLMYLSSKTSRTFAPYGFAGMGMTLTDLASAITRMEGSCSAPGVCVNNNPGNLRSYAAGQPVDSRGIRIFPTYEAGYDALLAQERVNIGKGLTLEEFFKGKGTCPGPSCIYPGYAPAADRNQPSVYAGNVSNWLGIPQDVPLSQLLNGGSNVYDVGATPAAGVSVDGDPWSQTASLPDWVSPSAFLTDGEELSPLAWGAIALAVGGAIWAAS